MQFITLDNESKQIIKLTHRIHDFLIIFFNSLFWYNEFTEVRQDSLHFDSIMNLIHYEATSATWAINIFMLTKKTSIIRKRLHLTTCNVTLIYMRKRRGLRIDPCGISLNTHAGWENAFTKLTKNVLFMR